MLAKLTIPDQYLASSRPVNAATARCYQHGAAGPWQVLTFTTGSKWRSLLMAGDDDECLWQDVSTLRLNVTLRQRQQNFVQSGPSSAEIWCYTDFQDGGRCVTILLPVSDLVTSLKVRDISKPYFIVIAQSTADT